MWTLCFKTSATLNVFWPLWFEVYFFSFWFDPTSQLRLESYFSGVHGVFVVHCLEYIFISLRNLYPYRSRNNHSDCSSLWGVCLCKLLPGPVGLLVTQNISFTQVFGDPVSEKHHFSWAYKTMRNVSWGVIVAYILHSIMLNGSTSGFWGHSYSLFLVYWFSIDQYTCSCFAHQV